MINPALIAYLADESQFSYAAQDILKVEAGMADPRMMWDPRSAPDEICSVQFKKQMPTGDFGWRTNLGVTPAPQEYSVFTGVLEVRYGLLRTANVGSELVGCSTVLDEKIGVIRACFLRSARLFTVGRLPNFAVVNIIEQVPTYGVDSTGNKERDFVFLPFLITYERVMGNMPAP